MTFALVHGHTPPNPRGWQLDAEERFEAYTGPKGALFSVATGSGKTFLGHLFAVKRLLRGERVLWLADQKTLVNQPLACLAKWWPDLVSRAGIVMNSKNRPNAQIVYASKDTLKNDRRMTELLAAGPFSLVVCDECHRSVSNSWIKVIKAASSEHTRFVGLTATPHREDNRSLSDFWELIYSYSILDALNDDVLVPPYAAISTVPNLDLSDVGTSQGDYDVAGLGRALLRAHIVEHTVAAMAKPHHAEELPFREKSEILSMRGRRILVHTASIEQAKLTAEALSATGDWVARYVSGETPDAEVERLFGLFREGKVNVLCAAAKLSEGVDLPEADATVFAAPTRSWTRYIQRIGRGLRTNGDKRLCFVLDLVNCTKTHHLVSAPVLVDGDDCEESETGQHRFLEIEGSFEGRCCDCGHIIKCMKRLGGHLFKDGACKACGSPQCADSHDQHHHWVAWEDHQRKCVHCEMLIADPLAGMLNRKVPRKEPVNWQELDGMRRPSWAADLGKVGILFTVQHGDDKFRTFLYARETLQPLAPGVVDGRVTRMLTDDVARRATKYKGMFGGMEHHHATVRLVKISALAKRLKLMEA